MNSNLIYAFQQKAKVHFFGMWLILIFLLTSYCPNVAHSNEYEKFSIESHKCFREEVENNLGTSYWNPYATFYSAEQIVSYLILLKDNSNIMDANSFCKDTLSKKYIQAIERSRNDPSFTHNRVFAYIASEVVVYSVRQNYLVSPFIKHGLTGHVDITNRALMGLPNELKLREPAMRLVAAASQTPDIYRWDDDRYHALTCSRPDLQKNRCFHDGEITPRFRQEVIAKNQELFIRHVSALSSSARRKIQQGQYALGLFWLGAGCHVLQDLAFHKGMTGRQHAALAYVLGRDPDDTRLPGGVDKIALGETLCLNFVESVLNASRSHMNALRNWRPDNKFNLRQLAERAYSVESTEIQIWPVVRYLLEGVKYGLLNSRKLLEAASSEDGVIEWDISQIRLRLQERQKID